MPVPLLPLDLEPTMVHAPAAHHHAGLRPEVAAFARRHGWRLRFSPRTGQPSFGFGRPVPLAGMAELVDDLADLADVPPGQLVALEGRSGGRFQTLRFGQVVDGRPIGGAGIDLFVVGGAIQAAHVELHRPPDDLALDGMDLIAAFPRGDGMGYAGATTVEADGLVTWFDAQGAPLRRFTRVLDVDGVHDGVTVVGERPAEPFTLDVLAKGRRWLAGVDPAHPTLAEPTPVAPGALGSSCRAELRDGVIRLGAGDGRCTPALSADLLRHEFAHRITVDGLLVDRLGRSFAEGAADVLSTEDPVVAEDLVDGGLRRLDEVRRLPGDRSFDVHQQGRVFGSMAWALRNDRGPEGRPAFDRWLVDLLRLGVEGPDLLELALLADDDDADLSNGTPQVCDLLARLSAHGLGSPELGVVRLDHTPALAMSSGVPAYPIVFDLTPIVPACATFDPASVRVELADGRSLTTDRTGTHHLALVPRVPVGRRVDYTLVWADAAGQTTRVGPFTFQVGDTRPVTCDLDAVDLDVTGAATLLRLEAHRDTRSPGARLTHGGSTVWSGTGLHDGGRRPFHVDLRGKHGTGALVASGMTLDDACVVALADPEGHHRVSDLRVDGQTLRWTVPLVEPVHAVELSRHDVPVATSEGGTVVGRFIGVSPGEPMLATIEGPGTYVVSVSDVDGHVYRSVVAGANQVTVDASPVDTGRIRDSADSADSGRPPDTGAP